MSLKDVRQAVISIPGVEKCTATTDSDAGIVQVQVTPCPGEDKTQVRDAVRKELVSISLVGMSYRVEVIDG